MKRNSINTNLINGVVVCFIVMGTLLLTCEQSRTTTNEFKSHMADTAKSESKLMTYRINNHIDTVEKVSIDERVKSLDWEIQKPFLEKSAQIYGYDAMSFTYTDGTLKSTSGTVIDVKGSPPYNAFMAGNKVIGDPIVSKAHGNLVMPVAVPTFDNNNNVIGATATDLNFNIVLDSLKQINLREDGVAFILNKRGDLISSTNNLNIADKNIKYNLLSLFEDNKEFVDFLNNAGEKEQSIECSIKDVSYLIESKEIEDTNWNLFVSYPTKTLNSKLTSLGLGYLVLGTMIIILWLGTFKVVTKHLSNALNKASENLAEEKEKSRIDYLTKLSNKGYFEEFLASKLTQQKELNGNLAVMMIDVDNFKKYNDNYGHLKGDDVLRSVGSILNKCILAPNDLAARFGGEEFVLVLCDYNKKDLEDKTTQIVNAIKELGITHDFSDAANVVTISAGVVTIDESNYDESIASLIEQADKALYESKKNGKNRCTQYNKTNTL